MQVLLLSEVTVVFGNQSFESIFLCDRLPWPLDLSHGNGVVVCVLMCWVCSVRIRAVILSDLVIELPSSVSIGRTVMAVSKTRASKY